ncbi:MAG: leucyl aminopeptidase [Alphaproteobacteria bacterium]|nr:leucyl aminopeptidase [Alphaproteobacteria bacterium]
MHINFSKLEPSEEGVLVVGVPEKQTEDLTGIARDLDKRSKGAITKALATMRFTGGKNQLVEVLSPSGLDLDRLLVVGMGDAEKFDALAAESVGATAVARLLTSGQKEATFAVEVPKDATIDADTMAAHVALGCSLRGYRFDNYRTTLKKNEKPSLTKITIGTEDVAAAKKAWRQQEALSSGIVFARDLVTEPSNVLYPEEFARRARKLEELGVEVEVLDEKDMAKLGMHALLGVGQGSERETQLLVMQWKGASDRKAAPVAFVGKGVTFDTGGISLKPGAGMEAMKYDMGGAAAVTGAMYALAARKARANVVGICGLVENMPDGRAQRPGDVVKSMSGQTIEILNTDAEGRLVLADALWYCQNRFKPQFMVDLATLTGAIRISLGLEIAGLFSNNDQLSERLLAAGKAEGEELWRMPLGERFDRLIHSPIADMKNIGGQFGGSITAAAFLQRFVNKLPWAHLDIAGTAWFEEARCSTPRGASGFGVRLLNRLVADHYEG